MLVHVYRAEVDVPATPVAVWQVLTDFPAYPAWNPFTREVGCSLEVGTPVVMRVVMADRWALSQTETLREVVPAQRLVWALDIGMPWLLAAERVQTLEATPEGCRYTTVDTIEGLLSPVVHWIFGRSLQVGFAGMAEALGQRVQTLTSRG